MTNDRGIVANSLPDIDRGTDARAKMSRRRFLAFIMVGIMIVSAISMVMPAILDKGVNNNDNGEPASISWAPAGKREAIYKVNHLFENYMKMQNFTKGVHGAVARIQEAYLGHHWNGGLGSVMGQNEWLNTSLGANPRNAYGEMMMRNNYPYIGYWTPAATGVTGVPNPTRSSGLSTWAPYRMTGTVKNDTYLNTGNSNTSRNMPFGPYLNHSMGVPIRCPMVNGGYVNVSLYGSYMTAAEMDALNLGTHYGNWFYGLPAGVASDSAANDGYFYEIHGTITYNKSALQTFLNYTPGVASRNWKGVRTALDSTDAVTWFNAESSVLRDIFRTWMWENFSQPLAANKQVAQAYFKIAPYNANIFTVYEFDMIGGAELNFGMRLDPCNTIGAWNFSGARQLAIRVYWEGWGPDCAMFRMMQQANLSGSVGKVTSGLWMNRGSIINYGEDVFVNCSITRSMSNSSFRQVTVSQMLGWEDDSDSVWSGGWMINLGLAPDYLPNVVGSQDSYVSPMSKYRLNGVPAGDTANDAVTWGGTGTREKTTFWNGPGSPRFHTNATVCYGAPQVRNLTPYEAIIVDLNLNARASGQALALQPYLSVLATAGAAKTGEYGRWAYWGTLKLGQGCYPQAQILAGYDAGTKILNLSGGTTGLTMSLTYNTDWWGGRTGQPDIIYTRGAPIIQLDVAAVDHYQVTLQNATHTVGITEKVKVTPLNKTNQIPRNGFGRLIVNSSVQLSINKDMKLAYPSWVTGSGANGSLLTFNNATNPGGSAWTKITFNAVDLNGYINATDVQFGFLVGAGLQNQTGSLGPFAIGVIPEFTTVLLPIVGMMAMFFVFRTIKRKREE